MIERLIKYGEFTFCSMCGEICKRTDKDFMCIRCREHLFSWDRTEQEREELQLAARFEEMCSDVHKGHRKTLAAKREQRLGLT